jgi:hypothetical protein
MHSNLLCVSVTPEEPADVYCLEVPSNHAFAVESGVIVHNCMDCLRYLVRSGRSVASVQKPQGVTSSGFMAADTTAGY